MPYLWALRWAKLSAITGDQKYNDWMFEEFKATTDHLLMQMKRFSIATIAILADVLMAKKSSGHVETGGCTQA